MLLFQVQKQAAQMMADLAAQKEKQKEEEREKEKLELITKLKILRAVWDNAFKITDKEERSTAMDLALTKAKEDSLILAVALVYELSTGALDWGLKNRDGRHPEEQN